MTFEDVLNYFKIELDDIETMYLDLPSSISDDEIIPYYSIKMNNHFNDFLAKKVPFTIDFCLNGAMYFINDNSILDAANQDSKDTYIIYNEDGTPYIYTTTDRLHIDGEHLFDDYNKNLINIYKVMNAV